MASVQRVFELSLAPLHLLLHGVEPLLVLGLHLLRLLSGPDVPLLLLGELLLVLGLNLLNLAVRLAVVVAASVSKEELLQRINTTIRIKDKPHPHIG